MNEVKNEFDAAIEITKMMRNLRRDEEGEITPESMQNFRQGLKKVAVLKRVSEEKTDKDEILAAIDKAKLSILRGIHSKDKTARLLINLVEEMHKTCPAPMWVCAGCQVMHPPELFEGQDPDQITCPTCGTYMYLNDPEAIILETDAFKEADAYVLGINTIRNSKKKNNGDDTDTA